MSPSPKDRSLRSLVETALLSASVAGVVFVIVTAVVAAVSNARSEKERRHSEIHATVSNLLLPPLQISDYGEARKILTFLSRPNEIVAVGTQGGDILLSDYDRYPVVRALLKPGTVSWSCEDLPTRRVEVNGTSYRIYCTNLTPPSPGPAKGKSLGVLLTADSGGFSYLVPGLLVPLVVAGLVATALLLLIFRSLMGRRVLRPFERLLAQVNALAKAPLENTPPYPPLERAPQEFKALKQSVEALVQASKQEHEKLNEISRDAALFELAQEIAHDMRSPLAALTMEITLQKDALDEASQRRLEAVATRIREISKRLSTAKKRLSDSTAVARPTETSSHLLSRLVDAILFEKRAQYRNRPEVELDYRTPFTERMAFAQVEPAEFKRVLSNLIDNAYEAIEGAGLIEIETFQTSEWVTIKIKDNGRGVSPEQLGMLMKRGVSFNKKSGSGLGLYHAKTTLSAWGGDLHMDSEEGRGTVLTLVLKRAQMPSWLPDSLSLRDIKTVVIVDNDECMHATWDYRFHAALPEGAGVELKHFSNSGAFSRWCEGADLSRTLFLMDYDLNEKEHNGLSLIERFRLGARSIVVSGSPEEEMLSKECQRLGARLLPKHLVVAIPITEGPTC